MTWRNGPGNTIISDYGETFDVETLILTLPNGEQIQTLPVSKAAQEGAEEYLRILES